MDLLEVSDMKTATLLHSGVPWMPPITNLYVGEDGKYLLVLVTSPNHLRSVLDDMSPGVQIARSHIPVEVSVFLADGNGAVVDYDGTPSNGLTPIVSSNPRSHAGMAVPDLMGYADALAVLGYCVT